MASLPSRIHGFHGTDQKTADEIMRNGRFSPSGNLYDWLGPGVYFWENNAERSRQFAVTIKKFSAPRVIAVEIDLGICLDLFNQEYLDLLVLAYKKLKQSHKAFDKPLPKNGKFFSSDLDFKKRLLDCQVILAAQEIAKENDVQFDSVRAGFWEGKKLYPYSGFREYNHIQVAVINQERCIKKICLLD